MTSRDTGEVIVVIEAPDAMAACERFMRVRYIIRNATEHRGVVSIKEYPLDAPCHCSFFADAFFQVLASADALDSET